ncbi:unnamed protein product [Paramecium primaurelia]|uniref:Uncharacterized protein n=1 Tax=Paramecium primaurelia TaxID=5886 RepID=A0A8S1KU27_PARPR|nr:unnamed protein product [Paramecium primaurelia]
MRLVIIIMLGKLLFFFEKVFVRNFHFEQAECYIQTIIQLNLMGLVNRNIKNLEKNVNNVQITLNEPLQIE